MSTRFITDLGHSPALVDKATGETTSVGMGSWPLPQPTARQKSSRSQMTSIYFKSNMDPTCPSTASCKAQTKPPARSTSDARGQLHDLIFPRLEDHHEARVPLHPKGLHG